MPRAASPFARESTAEIWRLVGRFLAEVDPLVDQKLTMKRRLAAYERLHEALAELKLRGIQMTFDRSDRQ